MKVGMTTMITILRPQRIPARYSTIGVPDWTKEPHREPVPYPVSVQPGSSSEGAPERPAVTTSWVLISPPETTPEIGPEDRIETDFGSVLAVDGEVARFPHPHVVGAVHHIQVALKLVTG